MQIFQSFSCDCFLIQEPLKIEISISDGNLQGFQVHLLAQDCIWVFCSLLLCLFINLKYLFKFIIQHQLMKNQKFQGPENIFKIDKCRRYFPKYDQSTFLQQVSYTDAQIINYFPERFLQQYRDFKKAGQYLNAGFWVTNIFFVSFCHKIKILSRLLGDKTWKMFVFKIACIALPLNFIQKIEQDASDQFYKSFFRETSKFYRRYKQTGDILDLNRKIVLEESQNHSDIINQFSLISQNTSMNSKIMQELM